MYNHIARIRRGYLKKYIVHRIGFWVYSWWCIQRTDKCAANMANNESISSHPPQSGQRHSTIELYDSIYAVDEVYV